jgi:hypothetical protein
MKTPNFHICLLAILLLSMAHMNCSSPTAIPYERNGQVEFAAGDKSTLTVTSRAAAATSGKAAAYAERNALENILFKGIPGSNQENPMISPEPSVKPAALADLINGGYSRFLMQSIYLENRGGKGGFTVLQEVKFDMQALRKYLEDNQLVRKFGM